MPWARPPRVGGCTVVQHGVELTNTRITRLEMQHYEALIVFNARASGVNMKVSLSGCRHGLPVGFLVMPHCSSSLRLGNRNRHVLKMDVRDRVFVTISEWVFARVRDPLVEIDPVTVNKAIVAEKDFDIEDVRKSTVSPADSPLTAEDECAPTVAATGFTPLQYFRRAFPRGPAIAPAIVLLVAALITAAILALRHSTTNRVASKPETTNGGIREEVSTNRGFRDLNPAHSDKAVPVMRPSPQGRHSVQNQSTPSTSTSFYPISDSPLAPSPSLSAISAKKSPMFGKKTDSLRTGDGGEDPVISAKFSASNQTHPTVDMITCAEDQVVIRNGDNSATASTVEFDSTPKNSESSFAEEIKSRTKATETQRDSHRIGESSGESQTIPKLPSAVKLFEEAVKEYDVQDDLIEVSTSLSAVGEVSAEDVAIEALLNADEVGDPLNSILVNDSANQPPSAEFPSEFQVPIQTPITAADSQADEERRMEYTEALGKVLPAFCVGSGAVALGSISGVDGALQVVGLLAAAGFLTREIIWAAPREKLLSDIRNIRNHKELVKFLKGRNMIPESWNQ